jgi:hypothetical protein
LISKIGIINVNAKRNLARKVAMVDSQICLGLETPLHSCETRIPSASDKASAIAIVRIPPMTASVECVPASSHTIRPSVVMMPDVIQKFIQTLMDLSNFMEERKRINTQVI